VRSFRICTLLEILLDKAKANEVGRACGTHEREDKSVQGFGRKAQRKETTRKNKA
jgi:hypothetical protein